MTARLDAIDRALLDALQHDAKASLAALGRQVGLSAPSVMERVRKLRPTADTPLHWSALMLVAAERHEPALTVLQELHARRPDFVTTRMNLSSALAELGRTAEALAMARAAREEGAVSFQFRAHVGRIVLKTRGLEEGLRHAVEDCLVAQRGLGWQGMEFVRAALEPCSNELPRLRLASQSASTSSFFQNEEDYPVFLIHEEVPREAGGWSSFLQDSSNAESNSFPCSSCASLRRAGTSSLS